MSSTASIVLNLFFGFLFVGASALVGTPILYYLTENFDYTLLTNEDTRNHVISHNEEVLTFFEAFPFVIGVALFVRGILMVRARGQELA